jgi:isoquinoline 1-oxidoreductase subunit beta
VGQDHSNAVTLIALHTDVGQGAVHMQALLLAEELDLEPGQFETDFGAPSAVYCNAAMAAEGVPFATTDTGRLAETVRALIDGAAWATGLQATGGSTSVPDSYDKLQQAGAVARETLKKAATAVHQVPLQALTTSRGAVVLPDGVHIPYQSLAAAAAAQEPVCGTSPFAIRSTGG